MVVVERSFPPGEDAAWIGETRHHLEALHVRALEAHAATSLAIGGTELAGRGPRSTPAHSPRPLWESGYRYLMELLAADGNLAEALHTCGRLNEGLREQLAFNRAFRRDLYERLQA